MGGVMTRDDACSCFSPYARALGNLMDYPSSGVITRIHEGRPETTHERSVASVNVRVAICARPDCSRLTLHSLCEVHR